MAGVITDPTNPERQLKVNADGSLNASTTVVTAGAQGSLTDRSGTIAVGGTSQQVMAANAARKYLFVQNVSTGDLWIRFGPPAVLDQPSIRLGQWDSFVMEAGFVSTQASTIIGATTGQAYSAKEA